MSDFADLVNVLLFNGGHALNLVLLSSLFLGIGASLVGAFFYLRANILLADALSHATLPGIAIGFLVALGLGLDGGRNPAILMIGAFISAALGAASVQWIVTNTRLRYDVATATVLSVFYGAGIVLLSYIQRLENASQAGLDSFLLGQIVGMSTGEAMMIVCLSCIVVLVSLIFFRDFLLLCFDPSYAFCIGRPTVRIDRILLVLILAVICTGLKTVGLILILALLVMPATIARFWSARIKPFIVVSCVSSALACYIGAGMSAAYNNFPTGSTIVLCLAFMLIFSLLFGTDKGVLRQLARKRNGRQVRHG